MEYFWHELCSFPVLLYVRGKPKLQYCFPTEWHRRTGATPVFLFTRSSALFINIQSTIDKQKYILYIQFCQKKWIRFTFLSTLCMPVQYYLLPRSSLKALVSPMFQSTFLEKHYAESTLCYIAILSVIYFQSQIIFHCLHHLMWDIFLCKLSEIVFSRYICTVYLTILSNPVER